MQVREMYAPFETGMLAGSARVFDHEIPGGQVTPHSDLIPPPAVVGVACAPRPPPTGKTTLCNKLRGNRACAAVAVAQALAGGVTVRVRTATATRSV